MLLTKWMMVRRRCGCRRLGFGFLLLLFGREAFVSLLVVQYRLLPHSSRAPLPILTPLQVHAPVAPTQECVRLVEELGEEVRYIVLPTTAVRDGVTKGRADEIGYQCWCLCVKDRSHCCFGLFL